MNFWLAKRVHVAGASGFIGRHCVKELLARGAVVVGGIDHAVDMVINLAAKTAGIGYASSHHSEMLRKNLEISTQVIERARIANVPTFVVVSSACVYSDQAQSPMPESLGMVGSPVEASKGYGWAKRIAEVQGMMYAEEYGMRVPIARPFNAYGPGDVSGHVIPDLLRKIDAGGALEVWGGDQTRSMTYVTDWVDALLLIAEHGPSGQPVNLAGTESGVRISDLARVLAGDDRPIISQPGVIGHHDRRPDLSWLKSQGWTPRVVLEDGLKMTKDWWRSR